MERRVRVVGGKTLVLKVECQGDDVKSVRLRGDFFFYPEEGLAKLESFIMETSAWRLEDIGGAITQFLQEHDLTAVGFAPADLAFLLRGLKC
jgi:hypothetical protein